MFILARSWQLFPSVVRRPCGRTSCVIAALWMLLFAQGAWADRNNDVQLQSLPGKLYLVPSNPKESLAGSTFFLVVTTSEEIAVHAVDLRLDYLDDDEVRLTHHLPESALEAIDRPGLPATLLTGKEPATPTFLPHAYRISMQVPAAWSINGIRATLRYRTSGKRIRTSMQEFPLSVFRQRTALMFPFKGKGIVSQGGVFEAGHRNRSGMYALDALGLDDRYAPILRNDDQVSSYAGWGRTVIAPGPGTIIHARRDRPDQPVDGVSDPAFFASEFPNGGDPGNSVVIDHGNGEFSMIAHMKHDSVVVKVGDTVKAGDPLGQLGNSGDTSGPHVHYQLQDGPDWQFANALPATFGNIRSTAKGTFFDAE